MSTIRIAEITDRQRIIDIYNQAIMQGFQTADTTLLSVEDRMEWFADHQNTKYPIYIYEIDSYVVGWLSISPYRKGRKALRYTAEVSYYIDKNFQQQGIGSALMAYALEQLPLLQIKSLIAILLDVNQGSIRLLEKFGFKQWGHLPNIADFSGIVCGQNYYGYQVNDLKNKSK